MLTFFAQDHASTEMVYANAEITKAEQAREIISFANYGDDATGEDPGLLVFDSQLTTYKVLDANPHRARHPLAHPAPTRQHRTRPPDSPYPPAGGRPPPSPAPGATGAHNCTKT